MLCKFCQGLSIQHLIELAEAEPVDSTSFPRKSYYRHQASYTNLLRSAQEGCSLCTLICSGCQELEISSMESTEWTGWTRSGAALNNESGGKPSDIKVCLSSDHLMSNVPLDPVELFDLLLIQVGDLPPVLEYEDSFKDTQEWIYYYHIPPLRLVLSVPRDKPYEVGKYRVGRFQVDRNLSSSDNFNIARHWLKNCLELHQGCPSNQASKLPTRVIDVGIVDGSQTPRLFLSNSLKGNYATLSHCWGGEVSPVLTTSTLDSFQQSLPMADLPANFRDAISITKQLGIPYLWIDCLCIIQKSKEDWETESKKMGSLYRDALVTISAVNSHSSTDGILKTSPTVSKVSAHSAVLNLSPDGEGAEIVRVTLAEEGEESLGPLFVESPLFKRGWTLQEEILSPRVLYYGSSKIYWKCLQGYRSADEIPMGRLMPDESLIHPETSKLLRPHTLLTLSSNPDMNDILKEFYEIVEQYNMRQLSFPSDKLPALSGLAALVHPLIGGQYLAGIWSKDFRQGLMWYRDLHNSRATSLNQAPSWSWASTNDPIAFRIPGYEKSGCRSYHAQLLSHELDLQSENIYGPVNSGTLVIRGLTKNLFRSRQMFKKTEFVASIDFDEWETKADWSSVYGISFDSQDWFFAALDSEDSACTKFDPQDINVELVSEQEYLVLIIDSEFSTTDSSSENVNCLVLIRTTDVDEKYCRAGFLRSSYLEENELEKWLEEGWTSRTVTLV